MNKQISSSRRGQKFHLYEQGPLYLLMLPAIIHLAIFGYGPMYGLQIAFKDFKPVRGIWGSPWVGLKHFERFFSHPDLWMLISNTLTLTLYSLALFPVPIICALIMNEVSNRRAKNVAQTITYAPHFISTVVLCSMVIIFLNRSSGLVNNLIALMGGERIDILGNAAMFPHIYVLSGVWQQTGWSMVIYLSALSSVPQECVEAAKVDGANRLQIVRHVNFPHIVPTVIILFILRFGGLLSVGHEKVLLLQNPLNLAKSTVLSTYVYDIGLVSGQFSYSSAIGLVNTLISLSLVIIVNKISNRLSQTSLW